MLASYETKEQKKYEFEINILCKTFQTPKVFKLFLKDSAQNKNIVIKVTLPCFIILFMKFLPIKIDFQKEAFNRCESLSSYSITIIDKKSFHHFFNDINLLFPHIVEIERNSYFFGIFSLLNHPNLVLIYVLKVNMKLRRILIEVSDPKLAEKEAKLDRTQMKKISNKIVNGLCYLIKSNY